MRLRKLQEVSFKFSPSGLSLVGGYCSLRTWGIEPRLWSGDEVFSSWRLNAVRPEFSDKVFLATFVAFVWELNLQFSSVLLLLRWFSFVDEPLVVPANLVKPSQRGYFVAIRNLEISGVLAYWSYCTKYWYMLIWKKFQNFCEIIPSSLWPNLVLARYSNDSCRSVGMLVGLWRHGMTASDWSAHGWRSGRHSSASACSHVIGPRSWAACVAMVTCMEPSGMPGAWYTCVHGLPAPFLSR